MSETGVSGVNTALGTSAAGREMLAHDWTGTALGGPSGWPVSLGALVMMMLACPKPMFLAWGPELTILHNDAYRPLLGTRAPGAIGQPFRALWQDIWRDIGALVEATLAGESRCMPDLQHDLHWQEFPEEGRPTTTYSPVRDDAGAVAGLICIVDETAQAIAARRGRAAQDKKLETVAADGISIGTWDWDVAADSVTANARFALLYGVDPARAAAGVPIAEFLAGIHADDLPRVRLQVAEALKCGGVFTSIYRLIGEVGVVRWVCAQGRCIFDDSGQCIRFPGVSFDITERIAADTGA